MLSLSAPLLSFSPPSLAPRALPRASTPSLSVSGGTETLDFTQGALRSQKELTDGDLFAMGRRARPSLDWSNLRARLEVEFGFTEEELSKYDAIQKDDLLKVLCPPARAPSGYLALSLSLVLALARSPSLSLPLALPPLPPRPPSPPPLVLSGALSADRAPVVVLTAVHTFSPPPSPFPARRATCVRSSWLNPLAPALPATGL